MPTRLWLIPRTARISRGQQKLLAANVADGSDLWPDRIYSVNSTRIIHEAYLKLQNIEEFNDREHLLRASALAMRHILVNHARDRMASKRGGGVPDVAMDDAPEVGAAPDEAVLEINEALERLAGFSPRLAQVVECRFFAGYDDAETAAALGLTDRTVRRDWVKARAWLRRELGGRAGRAGSVLEDAP